MSQASRAAGLAAGDETSESTRESPAKRRTTRMISPARIEPIAIQRKIERRRPAAR